MEISDIDHFRQQTNDEEMKGVFILYIHMHRDVVCVFDVMYIFIYTHNFNGIAIRAIAIDEIEAIW